MADISTLYEGLAVGGLIYGPAFQGVTAAWTHPDGTVYADVALPEGTDVAGYLIHPALLDTALHFQDAAGLGSVPGNEGR